MSADEPDNNDLVSPDEVDEDSDSVPFGTLLSEYHAELVASGSPMAIQVAALHARGARRARLLLDLSPRESPWSQVQHAAQLWPLLADFIAGVGADAAVDACAGMGVAARGARKRARTANAWLKWLNERGALAGTGSSHLRSRVRGTVAKLRRAAAVGRIARAVGQEAVAAEDVHTQESEVPTTAVVVRADGGLVHLRPIADLALDTDVVADGNLVVVTAPPRLVALLRTGDRLLATFVPAPEPGAALEFRELVQVWAADCSHDDGDGQWTASDEEEGDDEDEVSGALEVENEQGSAGPAFVASVLAHGLRARWLNEGSREPGNALFCAKDTDFDEEEDDCEKDDANFGDYEVKGAGNADLRAGVSSVDVPLAALPSTHASAVSSFAATPTPSQCLLQGVIDWEHAADSRRHIAAPRVSTAALSLRPPMRRPASLPIPVSGGSARSGDSTNDADDARMTLAASAAAVGIEAIAALLPAAAGTVGALREG